MSDYGYPKNVLTLCAFFHTFCEMKRIVAPLMIHYLY
jgi:hypothetical protein